MVTSIDYVGVVNLLSLLNHIVVEGAIVILTPTPLLPNVLLPNHMSSKSCEPFFYVYFSIGMSMHFSLDKTIIDIIVLCWQVSGQKTERAMGLVAKQQHDVAYNNVARQPLHGFRTHSLS